jgi:CRISPR-associated DxTHG motif protein
VKKIITFLGTRILEKSGQKIRTAYRFESAVYSGFVFPEALIQFLDFEQMLVLVTDEAQQTTWPVLAALADERIKPVHIPLGKSTAEMWRIFDIVLDHVDQGDRIVFDITHGFRSTPFLVFLFAAFLKFAREVEIEGVYYGALEQGNPWQGIPAPVFDLSEFVNMLDWLTATDRFVTTGDGQALSTLLSQEMPPGIQMGSDEKARTLGSNLRNAANGIDGMSRALRMARPFEAMQAGAQVSKVLKGSADTIVQAARPFEALAGEIRKSYGQFGLEDPLDPSLALESLAIQISLAGWYLKRQHAAHAALLLREWMISVIMGVTGEYPFNDRNKRKNVEDQLNSAMLTFRRFGKDGINHYDPTLLTLPDPNLFIKNWQRLSQLRNDIAHCGHRQNAQDAQALVKAANEAYQELSAMQAGLLRLVASGDQI